MLFRSEALLSAVPVPDPRIKAKRIVLDGDVADPSDPPSGCHFHPRCKYATERCRVEIPEFELKRDGHYAACFNSDKVAEAYHD